MTESEERAYLQGQRAILRRQLAEIVRELGHDDAERSRAAWLIEREDVIAQLRTLCSEHGDNDWPDEMHLGDVIEKHLARHLDTSG